MNALKTEASFDFILPGNWWKIDLFSEETAQAHIRQIAIDAFGKSDEVARLRADLRAELSRATSRAIDGDADSIYFAREVIEGVPLPVSLVISYTPDFAGISSMQPERNLITLTSSVNQLADHRENGGDGENEGRSQDQDDDEFVLGESAVVRRIRYNKPQEVPESEIAGQSGGFQVNYWISVPGQNRVLVLSFQSAFTELKEPLLQLYNAIIETINWVAPATENQDRVEPDADES